MDGAGRECVVRSGGGRLNERNDESHWSYPSHRSLTGSRNATTSIQRAADHAKTAPRIPRPLPAMIPIRRLSANQQLWPWRFHQVERGCHEVTARKQTATMGTSNRRNPKKTKQPAGVALLTKPPRIVAPVNSHRFSAQNTQRNPNRVKMPTPPKSVEAKSSADGAMG